PCCAGRPGAPDHRARLLPRAPVPARAGPSASTHRSHSRAHRDCARAPAAPARNPPAPRSEEHTSELQSQSNFVCRLLLEKKDHLNQWLGLVATLPPSFAREASELGVRTLLGTACLALNG